jgi:predicted dehydrogenase
MVLGTHTFDLMRLLAGDAKWCSARINVGGRKAVAADVRPLGEGIGSGVGDHITANYGFAGLTTGSFTSYKSKDAASSKYWLEVRGSKGQIHLGFGAFPPTYLNLDPTWMPAAKKTEWQAITSAGVGKPEPLKAADVGNGNRWIVDDLIEAIEKDRQPLSSITDGRAALEMILAVYESHRQERLVELPLKNRKHPLSGW